MQRNTYFCTHKQSIYTVYTPCFCSRNPAPTFNMKVGSGPGRAKSHKTYRETIDNYPPSYSCIHQDKTVCSIWPKQEKNSQGEQADISLQECYPLCIWHENISLSKVQVATQFIFQH
ncbi:hypothetical protein NQD34_007188 [Periophthalmus magnuspinnatus]|nr:hypothetical protein NQD34_007188 [Periophthalmus magnuspinnatus]